MIAALAVAAPLAGGARAPADRVVARTLSAAHLGVKVRVPRTVAMGAGLRLRVVLANRSARALRRVDVRLLLPKGIRLFRTRGVQVRTGTLRTVQRLPRRASRAVQFTLRAAVAAPGRRVVTVEIHPFRGRRVRFGVRLNIVRAARPGAGGAVVRAPAAAGGPVPPSPAAVGAPAPGPALPDRPMVTDTDPVDGARDVPRDTAVEVDVALPHAGGIDERTLGPGTVSLTGPRGAAIRANLNSSGGGDAIVLQPTDLLAPDTTYTFRITDAVKDLSGAAFVPFSMSFTTGRRLAIPFDPAARLARSQVYLGAAVSSVTVGPDGRLYGTGLDGALRRWDIDQATGGLRNLQTFTGLLGRSLVGLAFDPRDPGVLWVTNNATVLRSPAPDFSGRISRIHIAPGPALNATVDDYVVGLPRSVRDHLTNSLAFAPDGMLYVTQGSISAMGAPDRTWGLRQEHLLNAAVLRVDPRRTGGLPIDVQTEPGGGDAGTYNPFAPGAPVTLYATGLRNAYDLVWTRDGRLYAPTNGSAAGGNAPASPAGVVPAVPGIVNGPTQNDFLFRVDPDGYYGHPNPARGQYVMNGGNPTAGPDPAEVTARGSHAGYPVGTRPDRNYRGFAWDLGRNRSADGMVEYRGPAVGRSLDGRLLVAEYSAGDDIVALRRGVDGNIAPGGETRLASGLDNPLDLAEDGRTGFLYVAQLLDNGGGEIALMKPAPAIVPSPGARIDVINTDDLPSNDLLVSSRIGSLAAPPPDDVHDVNRVRVRNVGTGTLHLVDLSVSGLWRLDDPPALPVAIAPGRFVDVRVRFVAECCALSRGSLLIESDDADRPARVLDLAGLWQPAPQGNNEPGLGRIIQTFGWATTLTNSGQRLNTAGRPIPVGEEVIAPYWRRANPGRPVTVRAVAAFHGPPFTGGDTGGAGTFAWYIPNVSATTVLTERRPEDQTLLPRVEPGSVVPARADFVPSTPTFGFRLNREHSDDALNDATPDFANGCTGPCGHHVRAWPLRDATGLVPDTWIVAADLGGVNYDYNDLVYLVENVTPAG